MKPEPRPTVLFDLDDTLISSVILNHDGASAIVPSFGGFVTAFCIGSTPCITFVRPFALTLLRTVFNLGYNVGVWSAGSPPYVRAISKRLARAGRELDESFGPLCCVIALDQERMRWVDVNGREGRVICAARAGGLKHLPEVARHHPFLRSISLDDVLLVDNLPHLRAHTLRVPPFSADNAVRDTTLFRLSKWFEKHRRGNASFSQRREPALARAEWERNATAPDLGSIAHRWRKGDVAFRWRDDAMPVEAVRISRGAKVVDASTRTVRDDREVVLTNGERMRALDLRHMLL